MEVLVTIFIASTLHRLLKGKHVSEEVEKNNCEKHRIWSRYVIKVIVEDFLLLEPALHEEAVNTLS